MTATENVAGANEACCANGWTDGKATMNENAVGAIDGGDSAGRAPQIRLPLGVQFEAYRANVRTDGKATMNDNAVGAFDGGDSAGRAPKIRLSLSVQLCASRRGGRTLTETGWWGAGGMRGHPVPTMVYQR